MTDGTLDPLLRQFAEKRLGRALTPDDERLLLQQIQHAQNPPPPPPPPAAPAAPKTRQAVREQMRHFLQLNQQKAYEKMQGILQTIDTQHATTLGVLNQEQRKVAGMVDAREAAPPPVDAAQDTTQQALAAIGEHLADLIRQEVERCFALHLAPLALQVGEIHTWLAELNAFVTSTDAPLPVPVPVPVPTPTPAAETNAPAVAPAVHAPSGDASLD
jgi:hypothetical protein